MTQIEMILKESPVLDRDLHRTMMQEVEAYAVQAGVHTHYIWTPLSEIATQTEVDWVGRVPEMRKSGPYGVVYVGRDFSPSIEQRFMASAAACVRNFVDARVIPLHRLVDRLRQGPVGCSVLLVPNFSVDEAEGGYLPKWMKGILLDMLYDRLLSQQVTVLGVRSMKELEASFGESFLSVIKEHYEKVGK